MAAPRDPPQADAELMARRWVESFSDFPQGTLGSIEASEAGDVVLLTGSTGAVGCHVLHSLIRRPGVARVYCLVRPKNSTTASARLEKVLVDRHLLDDITIEQRDKITTMPYDVGCQERLGLSESDYETLRRSVTVIIHNAWAVGLSAIGIPQDEGLTAGLNKNVNMRIEGFEPHCRGTFDLLNLALRSELRKRPDFVYVSTASVAFGATSRPIREALYGIEATGKVANYVVSKWAAEQICAAAAARTGLRVRILRLAQICGDTKLGVWNANEAFPQIIASARTIGALPARGGDEGHDWLPADVTGDVVSDLSLLDQVDRAARASLPSPHVLHVANRTPVGWRSVVLPAARRHGLAFAVVPWAEWVARLEASDADARRNPPYRLLGFFRAMARGSGGPSLDMTSACRLSPRLARGATVDGVLVGKFLRFWESQPGWAGRSHTAKL